jgi:hypothetical protein
LFDRTNHDVSEMTNARVRVSECTVFETETSVATYRA